MPTNPLPCPRYCQNSYPSYLPSLDREVIPQGPRGTKTPATTAGNAVPPTYCHHISAVEGTMETGYRQLAGNNDKMTNILLLGSFNTT